MAPDETACAIRCAWPLGREEKWEAIRLWKIAPSAAIPVAIPIWRNVLLIPEAIPARRGSTTLTAVDASGALTRPMPIPPTMKPGRSVVQLEFSLMPHISRSDRPTTAESSAEQDPHGNPLRQSSGDRRDDE